MVRIVIILRGALLIVTLGTCILANNAPPGSAGIAQMHHFVTKSSLSAFRLPVAWQYLTNNILGGHLDTTNGAIYDGLVQGCVGAASSLCIIDIHNYARWNGNIIGQSGGAVTDAHLVTIWTDLATKYASESTVAFGIMNEPHDLNMGTWSQTVQKVVTAIRNAAGNSNIILLPGAQYSSAGAFPSASAPYMSNITNPDGTTTNLVFDVHQYLDPSGAGTGSTCDHNNVTPNNATGAVGAFPKLATWLRANGRQAFLSETGGSSGSSCLVNLCEQFKYLMENDDVFLGWTAWGAGSFSTGYTLTETPSGSIGAYTDQLIVSECVAGIYNKNS